MRQWITKSTYYSLFGHFTLSGVDEIICLCHGQPCLQYCYSGLFTSLSLVHACSTWHITCRYSKHSASIKFQHPFTQICIYVSMHDAPTPSITQTHGACCEFECGEILYPMQATHLPLQLLECCVIDSPFRFRSPERSTLSTAIVTPWFHQKGCTWYDF